MWRRKLHRTIHSATPLKPYAGYRGKGNEKLWNAAVPLPAISTQSQLFFHQDPTHVQWHMETGWAHEPRGTESPAFPEQHPGSTWPLLTSTPIDGGGRPSDGKTHFTAEEESQKIIQTPGCYLLVMPADKIFRSKTNLVGQYLCLLKSEQGSPLGHWKVVVPKTSNQWRFYKHSGVSCSVHVP